jgi:AraC-like DNA-binding protein
MLMYQVINRVLDYIEEHIQVDIKLEDISRLMYYSPWHISRWFNHYVGLSFNEYINLRRLSLAALMIKNTDKPIEFVAHYYGYNSAKYFSNLFKKHFYISPRDYRSNNYFVDLQIKRILKGDKRMEILILSNLVIEIMKNSSNQNELLDTIAMIDNCVLYEQKNSDLVIIAYCVNDDGDYLLMQVDINLMNGKYLGKLIHKTTGNKDIVIDKLYVEDETVYVEYRSLSRHNTILAKLISVAESKVEFATNILTNIEYKNDFKQNEEIVTKVKETADLLSKVNHVYEIEDYVKKDNQLLLLRGFDKEFVLLKLIEDTNNLFLYSIYLNFQENIEEINNIYAVNKGNKVVNFVIEKNFACIYLDCELHSQSYINIGNEVPPKFVISFPNGMTGRGCWDISSLFSI